MEYPDYDPALETPPLADNELDDLDTLLRGLPGDAAMNVEALDGYLTALLAGPRSLRTLPSARWMPVIWGGDGEGAAPFASQKQKKRAIVLVLRHLHAIDRALQGDPELWEPVVSVAETDDGELVDAEDWCAGFLQAVPLDPEGWGALFDDPVWGPALTPVAVMGGADGGPQDPLERDDASRAALDLMPPLSQRG